MAVITAEDRVALTDSLHRLLADKSAESDVRRAMETPTGYDPELWRQLAEMGVVGLIVEEAYGGVGAGPVELERVMEEAGAALLCAPLLSSGVLAAGLLQALDDEAAKTRLLPAIADGSKIATVALTGVKGGWTLGDVSVSAEARGDDAWALSGVAGFVTDGQGADLLLESESAISAARNAAAKLADGAKDAGEALSLAAFACADAYSTITATAIQMHGGIAFTWAHPAHLYLRRARADAQLFGGSAQHRERYLKELGA